MYEKIRKNCNNGVFYKWSVALVDKFEQRKLLRAVGGCSGTNG